MCCVSVVVVVLATVRSGRQGKMDLLVSDWGGSV